MALVAFDLDNTLGFFYHIAPAAEFLAPDCVDNPVQRAVSASKPHPLSPALRSKLAAAEADFFTRIQTQPALVESILRPNLAAMIRPLVTAKAEGRVRAVCIYSNTWVAMTMRLAVFLIERAYQCPGLFDAIVDATHPIRHEDWKVMQAGEPRKTLPVLKRVFRELCGVTGPIRPTDILFVDERPVRHALQTEVAHGLTYLQPTVWSPRLDADVKAAVRDTLTLVLHESGLLRNKDYMDSAFFNRTILTYDLDRVPIRNVMDLLQYVHDAIESADADPVPFKKDSAAIRQQLIPFLRRF